MCSVEKRTQHRIQTPTRMDSSFKNGFQIHSGFVHTDNYRKVKFHVQWTSNLFINWIKIKCRQKKYHLMWTGAESIKCVYFIFS